jgi:uncharacterized protein (UPF0254 family)
MLKNKFIYSSANANKQPLCFCSNFASRNVKTDMNFTGSHFVGFSMQTQSDIRVVSSIVLPTLHPAFT